MVVSRGSGRGLRGGGLHSCFLRSAGGLADRAQAWPPCWND